MKHLNNGQFGVAIRRLRVEKGMTQAELAAGCGYNAGVNISRLELGYTVVTCANIARIAGAMNISIGAIINEAGRVRDAYTKSSSEFITRAATVRRRRTELGLTQRALSKTCHVLQRSISDVERHVSVSPLVVVTPFMWETLTLMEEALAKYSPPLTSSVNLDSPTGTPTETTDTISYNAMRDIDNPYVFISFDHLRHKREIGEEIRKYEASIRGNTHSKKQAEEGG